MTSKSNQPQQSVSGYFSLLSISTAQKVFDVLVEAGLLEDNDDDWCEVESLTEDAIGDLLSQVEGYIELKEQPHAK